MMLRSLLIVVLVAAWPLPSQAAGPKIVEVVSAGGIKAWLVEDHKLPLIAVRFAFAGGVETDPVDKQGLAVLTTNLLTQGAGPYDDQAFQEKLAALSIQMDISAGRDYTQGEVKCLSRAKDDAFRLLGLALTQPRFDREAFDQLRSRQQTALTAQLASPGWQGRVALYGALFGDHPYAYRSLGTGRSLQTLTPDDARQFVKDYMTKDRLSVAVVGAISPVELRVALDRVFGPLPAQGKPDGLAPVVWPDESRTTTVTREGTQTNLLLALPMPKREDPDWYAADIANHILGGGGFTARLMKAVRAQKGLTYGISTSLAPMRKTSMLSGAVSADNDKIAQALTLTKTVWQDFYDRGVTAEEVGAAQDYLTGSLPLALTSTDAIADVLLGMQTQKLGMDYLDRHAALYRAVTKEDVERAIKKWFDPTRLSYSMVGKPEGIAADETREMLKE